MRESVPRWLPLAGGVQQIVLLREERTAIRALLVGNLCTRKGFFCPEGFLQLSQLKILNERVPVFFLHLVNGTRVAPEVLGECEESNVAEVIDLQVHGLLVAILEGGGFLNPYAAFAGKLRGNQNHRSLPADVHGIITI